MPACIITKKLYIHNSEYKRKLKKRDQHNKETRRSYLKILIGSGSEKALKKIEDSPAFRAILKEEWDRRPAGNRIEAPSKEVMLERILERTGQPQPHPGVRRPGSRILKYAAIVLPFLLVAAGVLYFTVIRQGTGINPQFVEVTTTVDQLEYILPDGSNVVLNRDSRLTHPEVFNRRTREITLSGEAYFDVVKEKGRPFIVSTPEVQIEVLGTQFNVMSYQESEITETTLLGGRVRITRENPETGRRQSVVLTPGHQATFFKGEERFIMDKVKAEGAIAWQSGGLAFDNTVFRSVIVRVEQRYDIDIELSDEAIGDMRISLQIDDESLGEVLTIISKTLSVSYTIDNGRVVFSPREK